MPQFFLSEAGLPLTAFKGQAGFSGSHDTTIKLVESGSYEVGVLNASVWDDRLKAGKFDATKVREIFRTPTYHDYHWLIRPDVDQRLGSGMTDRVKQVLLDLNPADDKQKTILELFQTKGFVPTKAENYQQIETVARAAGLLK